MSASRWVTTALWLPRSLRPFLYSSSVILAISSSSLLLLLGPYCFCPLSCPFFILAWNVPFPQFSGRDLKSYPFCCFLLFLSIVHLRRPSYLSLLYSGTLHSVRYIVPFLPCLSLLFFSQLFVKPCQTTVLPSWIYFSLWWFWSPPPVQCYWRLIPTLAEENLGVTL